MIWTLTGRARVCDFHHTVFGNYVQVAFEGPNMETAPMPWLHVGEHRFHVGEVIIAIRHDSEVCSGVSQIVHYREAYGQLVKLGPCRITKLNPLEFS